MSDDPKPLTRKELAEFLPSMRAIKAFEKLFDLIPSSFNDITAELLAINLLIDALESAVDVLESNQVLTKQTIVDLGSTYVFDKTINVVDTDVTVNSLLMAQIAPIADGYTRPIEEVIFEKITIQPMPKAGSIDFYIQPQSGHIKGLYAITYTVAL